MKKFIMILAAFAMLGAAVVGVLNKNDVEAVIDDLDRVRAEVSDATEKLGAAEDERDDFAEKETQAKDGRNQAAAAVEGVKQNLKIIERSLEDITAEMKKAEIEKKELDLVVQQTFPNGDIKTPEDLQMTLTMLKDTLSEKQNQKAEMNAKLSSAAQTKQTEVAKVKQEEDYQIKRAQQVSLGGVVATVIAVNKEWGFVMVNAGRQNGVQPDDSLLVKRGNARIARLRLVTLEDTSVVADVVEESLSSGLAVQPGDKVIFE